jgi:CheY-like chemotaxis protein
MFGEKQHGKAQELMRILVVDDNYINRFVVRHLMEKRGHHVIEAESGEAALEAMSDKEIDFVLMDLRMPGMDGFETVRRYRSSTKHLPQVPIVALTSQNTQDCRDRSIAAGINALIAKPFDVSSIEYAIELIQKNGDLDGLQSR